MQAATADSLPVISLTIENLTAKDAQAIVNAVKGLPTLPSAVTVAGTASGKKRGRPSKADLEARAAAEAAEEADDTEEPDEDEGDGEEDEGDSDDGEEDEGDEDSEEDEGDDGEEDSDDGDEDGKYEDEKPRKGASSKGTGLSLEDDVVPACKAAAKKHGPKAVGNILAKKFKVKSVRDLPKAKYGDLLKALKALGKK